MRRRISLLCRLVIKHIKRQDWKGAWHVIQRSWRVFHDHLPYLLRVITSKFFIIVCTLLTLYFLMPVLFNVVTTTVFLLMMIVAVVAVVEQEKRNDDVMKERKKIDCTNHGRRKTDKKHKNRS